MMTLLSVGLPLVAMAALIPFYKIFEAVFPGIEPLLNKALAFNVFEWL